MVVSGRLVCKCGLKCWEGAPLLSIIVAQKVGGTVFTSTCAWQSPDCCSCHSVDGMVN